MQYKVDIQRYRPFFGRHNNNNNAILELEIANKVQQAPSEERILTLPYGYHLSVSKRLS